MDEPFQHDGHISRRGKACSLLELESYTSGTLPGEVDGALIYVSDGRNPGAGAGAGTVCVCFGKAGT